MKRRVRCLTCKDQGYIIIQQVGTADCPDCTKFTVSRRENKEDVKLSEAQMDCILTNLYGDGWRKFPFNGWAKPFQFMRNFIIESEERRKK